jgi:tetratricopeptide (TPR) repeat protein
LKGYLLSGFSSASLIILHGVLLSVVFDLSSSAIAIGQTSQDFVYSRRINSDPTLLMQQGTALLRSNHNEEAAVKFERLCAINPNSARGHYQWGLALLKIGRTVESTDQLKQAIHIDPQLADAWLTLAGIYQSTGDTDQAIGYYGEFVKRFPRDNDAQRAGGLLTLLAKQRPGGVAVLPPLSSSSGTSGDDSQKVAEPDKSTDRVLLPYAQADYLQEVISHGVMRWASQQMPLRVFIDSKCKLPAFRPDYVAILKKAFLDWADKSQDSISFVFSSGPAQSDIICRWTDEVSKFSANGEAAEARLYGSESGLAKGEIDILLVSPVSRKQLSEEQMRGIALHEVGHVLGLAGHSQNQDDIMFFSPHTTNYWRGISLRDAATLVRLYSEK